MAYEAKRRKIKRRSLKLKKRFDTSDAARTQRDEPPHIGHDEQGNWQGIGHQPRTIEVHRSRIMEKMKAASLLELMEMARVGGVFDSTHGPK